MSRVTSTDKVPQLSAKLILVQPNDTTPNVPDSAQADEALPTYERDDGLPTPKQMAAISKIAGPPSMQSVRSSLFD